LERGTFLVSETIVWDRRLEIAADARCLIGHAGAVLLRKCADQTGLTAALSVAMDRRDRLPGWDRDLVLVQLAVAIVVGATSLSDIGLLAHQAALFGAPPSDSTVRRTLEPFDTTTLTILAKARARVRAHVWDLITATAHGFPWLTIAGRILAGWIVIDLDATIIEPSSAKQGAAGTFNC
jgi:Transposase DDE domain group 1